MNEAVIMSGMELPVYKYAIYEISIPATVGMTQVNFPINNYLNGKRIVGIETYIDTDIDKSPVSNGNVTWSITNIRSCTLTLNTYDPTVSLPPAQSQGGGLVPGMGTADWIKQLPIVMLHRSWNTKTDERSTSISDKMRLPGTVIDWSKSYIQFVSAQTFDVNTSAIFGVYYL